MTDGRRILWGFMERETVVLSLGDDAPVAYSWNCAERHARTDHTIECLWVWHDCPKVYGPDTVVPGQRIGWGPTGVGLHTLHSIEPLHIEASILWSGCCGMHGFIRDGKWFPC